MLIAVIGGGAAGFFAAINCAISYPEHSVCIFEKSNKILSKVRVSGGGRCNVTNGAFDESRLADYYPRGNKEFRSAISRFSRNDTVNWFESHGVKLKTESDGRMFPVTNNSETIIRCLIDESAKNNIKVLMNHSIMSMAKKISGEFELRFSNGEIVMCDKVILAFGGNSNITAYRWIEEIGHTIIPPVPSLFTLNVHGSPLKGLEGISWQSASVSLEGFKYESTGPLLITHWGISGPSVLRLSAFAARWLSEKNYSAQCMVNWLPQLTEVFLREELISLKEKYGRRKMTSISFYELPDRLWKRLCVISDIDENENCGDVTKVKINKLVQNICRMTLQVRGKTTFKEEFVTCGGVSLKEIDMKTMESRIVEGVYFAGELINIDGITGGFNFQVAWTTGYLAGINAGSKNQ